MDDTTFSATAAARNTMVDCQVRPNKVTDPRVLDAMRALPRELFVPPGVAAIAYVDQDIPLGRGRVLMQPMVIARMVQLSRALPGERALVVGGGTGYGAALLAACGAVVTVLEEDAELRAMAAVLLPRFAPHASLVAGSLTDVAPGGPWDLILIEGAIPAIPPAFAGQLADGGRLVTILTGEAGMRSGLVQRGLLGQAVLAEPVPSAAPRRLSARVVFDCSTSSLPGFGLAPAFAFADSPFAG